MILHRLSVLTAAALALPAGAAAAQAAAPSHAAIDSIFAQYDKTTVPGCALGVYQDGRIIYDRGYGMANLEHRVPVTPSTAFYIASTSKQFAAFAVALLAHDGKLGLDDPVRKHVPELPSWADPITIRHLVHHTSGIRDYLGLWGLSGRSFADRIPEEHALALIAAQHATNFPPGTEWSYSNSGYFLLSQIVKRVTGTSLARFAQERMFGPLGMTSTHWRDDATRVVPDRAEGYQPGADGPVIVRTSFDLVGDGGLLTTVEDLVRWEANFRDNRLGGGAALIDLVTTPGRLADGSATDYAFGLTRSRYRGLETIEHGGSFIGFRAALTRFPSERFAVAVLCNDATAGPEQLAYRVADRYLAGRLAPMPAGQAGAAPAVRPALRDRLVGEYELGPGFVTRVVASGEGLAIALGAPMVLAPRSDSVFGIVGREGATAVFGTGPTGETTIRVSGFGAALGGPKLGAAPTITAAQAAALAGRYRSDELDTWADIRAAEGGIEARTRYQPWQPVRWLRVDEALVGGAKVVFRRDGRGRVTGFDLDAQRVLGIRFERVP